MAINSQRRADGFRGEKCRSTRGEGRDREGDMYYPGAAWTTIAGQLLRMEREHGKIARGIKKKR